ncbi:hypothetical protein BKA62DRAFT_669179 [Auriculariales sp. MPI-PUGE-AT-0066]|nr:hypothetical protein BKA62DRAFT_669179 [Auriculariales sp. MPI-PUGE-AT-0066]
MRQKREDDRAKREAKKLQDQNRYLTRRSCENLQSLPRSKIAQIAAGSVTCSVASPDLTAQVQHLDVVQDPAEPVHSMRIPVQNLPPSSLDALDAMSDSDEREPETEGSEEEGQIPLTQAQLRDEERFQLYCPETSRVSLNYAPSFCRQLICVQLTGGRHMRLANDLDLVEVYRAMQADCLGWRLVKDIEDDNHQAAAWTQLVLWAEEARCPKDYKLRLTERCYGIVSLLQGVAEIIEERAEHVAHRNAAVHAILTDLRKFIEKLEHMVLCLSDIRTPWPPGMLHGLARDNCLYWQIWVV